MGILRLIAGGSGSLNDVLKGINNLGIPLEELADDPLWDRSSEDVVFFNHQTPIIQLLDYCGYRSTSDSTDGFLGKWQVFQNENHLVSIYTGRLPKTWKQNQECEIARFMVYAPADTNKEEFIQDLEVITRKSLEMIGSVWCVNTSLAGLMGIGLGAAGFAELINLPDKYGGWFMVPMILLGGGLGALWGLQDYLGFGARLSLYAANYQYGRQALNTLKMEAFNKVIQTKLVPATELDLQKAYPITSVSEAEIGQLVSLDAIPITPFRPASSTITERGAMDANIQGTIEGYMIGIALGPVFGGIFRGTLEAQMQGDYAGTGEIGSIKDSSAIDYLMKDSQEGKFRLGAINHPDFFSYLLEQLSKRELGNDDGYLKLMEEHFSKLSLDKARLFYADILSICEREIDKRKPTEIYAWVVSKGELPMLQLVGFKYSNGKLVVLQKYATSPLLAGMSEEIKGIISGRKALPRAIDKYALPGLTE